MKKIRKHMMDNRILYRMISVFTLLCTVVLILMTTFMYNVFSRMIKEEIYRFQEQSLKQVANIVSFRAEYANYLMLQLQQDESSSRLFYPADQDTVMDSLETVNEMRYKVKQLHSIYIYDEQDDLIYYSGDNQLSVINEREDFEDKGFVEILDNIGEYSKYTPYLRELSVETPGGRTYQTHVYTYLLYDTYRSGRAKNIIAFNFHLGWMQDALDFITNGERTAERFCIVDGDRTVVYSDSGELIGHTFAGDELPDEIYKEDSGYHIIGEGNDKQMLVYATPTRIGYKDWTFISWNDYSALVSPLDNIRRAVYVICFCVFAFSVMMIVILSNALYRPVRHTIERVVTLEQEHQKKRKLDKVLFLRKLFLGNVKDDISVIKEQLEKNQIEAETENDLRVILLSIDYLNSYIRQTGNSLDKLDNMMERMIPECFEKRFGKLIHVKMQDGKWAICIPAVQKREELEEIFEGLNKGLQEKLNVTVSMAVSGVGHSVRDIPFLYSDALNINSYLYLWGENRLITDDDIRDQGQEKFVYPNDIEKHLVGSLFSAKQDEAEEAYQEFVEAIRRYTVEEIRLSFMLLAYGIKNASHRSIAESSSVLMEFDRFYKKLQSVGSIQEVHQLFHNLFAEIVDKLKVYSKERHEMLIGQIQEFVEQNYGDSNLSMNQVSDHVNMSAAYLGRLFKQVTGNTFTEYLTKFRLDIACNLLKNTNMTVNDISNEVGFTNSSYFYIIFKKNLECTPNQYRKQCGGKAEEEE